MTLLIQDATRPLLGGLIDDGSLVSTGPTDVTRSVTRFRSLRESPSGWMTGSFLVPAGSLEGVAGTLIRTMHPGEVPWSITAVIDDPGDASAAAAFHAAMDPAATIAATHLAGPAASTTDDVGRALAVARGVQPDTLPLITVDPSGDARRSIHLVALARVRALQPAGVFVDAACGVSAAALAETVIACVDEDVPLVLAAGAAPPVTTFDEGTGSPCYGVLNLLALAAGARSADAESLLLSDDTGAFTVGFGGMSSPAGHLRAVVGRPPSRGPLRSIVTPDPSLAISALAAHVSGE